MTICERCGEVNPAEIHTCTPKEIDPELAFIKDWNEGKVRRVSDGEIMQPMPQMQTRVTTPKDVEKIKSKWVGLTDEDKIEIQLLKWWDFEDTFDLDGYTRAIEAKLKEKNT
jgi:hypothetical protein